MGNTNCCNCIEKKETQINKLSNKDSPNEIYKKRNDLIKTIEFSKILKDKDSRYEDKLSFYSLDDDEKNGTKRTYRSNSNKFNETTQSYSISKDVSFKYLKKNDSSRYENTSPDLNNKNKDNYFIIENNNEINLNEDNIKKDIKINERNCSINSLKYYNTDYKKSKFNIYIKYMDNKIIDGNNNEGTLRNSNIYPIKYNYQKDKYISYFSEENV